MLFNPAERTPHGERMSGPETCPRMDNGQSLVRIYAQDIWIVPRGYRAQVGHCRCFIFWGSSNINDVVFCYSHHACLAGKLMTPNDVPRKLIFGIIMFGINLYSFAFICIWNSLLCHSINIFQTCYQLLGRVIECIWQLFYEHNNEGDLFFGNLSPNWGKSSESCAFAPVISFETSFGQQLAVPVDNLPKTQFFRPRIRYPTIFVGIPYPTEFLPRYPVSQH